MHMYTHKYSLQNMEEILVTVFALVTGHMVIAGTYKHLLLSLLISCSLGKHVYWL